MLTAIMVFMLIGVSAGFLAGLLGIGGGLVVVPALLFALQHMGWHAGHLMYVVVATSLANMIISAAVSVYWHQRHRSILWGLVASMAPGIVSGVLLGSLISHGLSSHLIKNLFGIFVLVIAIRMFCLVKPKLGRTLPGVCIRSLVALFIGLKSSLLGLGGGAITVPFFLRSNVSIHHATATSAACSLMIAILGTVVYALLAFNNHVHIPGCTGYIYWPAFFGIATTSSFVAPFGVKCAQWLPTDKLKRAFSLFLFIVAGNLLLGSI